MKKWTRKQYLWSCLVLVLCISVAACCLHFVNQSRLDQYQQEALEMLAANQGSYDEHRIVLANTTHTEANALAERFGAKLRITKDGSFATLTLSADITIQDVYGARENREYLEAMTPDFYAHPAQLQEQAVARPTYFDTIADEGFQKQTYLDYLNMQGVWNEVLGNGVKVAVIDTGIDTDHPEFQGRISEYSYNASEDKIVKDYDWSVIEDEQGHGTAVAGVIAGGFNGSGIVGIAPNVELIVIKAECDPLGGFIRSADLVFGMYYAIEQDVDIMNMSFGSSVNIFAEAARLAVDSDILCVAAAGNDATTLPTYPAADENVIGVGALEEDGWDLAWYSNYGDNSDVVAPGTTYTAKTGGGYAVTSGTSLACPVVVGGLALYLQNHGHYTTVEDVKEVLYASCYDLGDIGEDWYYGFGALDIHALVVQPKGTVTFNMLTEELDNTQQVFVRSHTLQDVPFPERTYAVFDGWYYDIDCTEELDLYADVFTADLTLYAKWVNEDDGVPYTYVELEDGTIEIRSYTGKRRFITIPDTIDGKPVTSIGEDAFSGQNRLREVHLPAYLRQIRDRAFSGCSNLTFVTIPDSVTYIGASAFLDNVRLSAVSFGTGSKLQTIGSFAFQNCSQLQRFELPSSVTSVDGSAFFGTTSLRQYSILGRSDHFLVSDGVLMDRSGTTIVAYPAGRAGEYILPSGVTTLGSYAFGYAKCKTMDLQGIQRVETAAFAFSRLESIVVPDSITELGGMAFYGNFYLKSASVGNGITTIKTRCFAACTKLETVKLSASVQSVGEAAFEDCEKLKNVTFANGSQLVSIGGGAFAYTGLEQIALPASLVVVQDGAFLKSMDLHTVTFGNNSQLQVIAAEVFDGCYSLKNLSLPAQVRTIGDFAFRDTALEEITLPASLQQLGTAAFGSCSKLQNIYVEAANPNYTDVDGVVYTADKKEIAAYPAGNPRAGYALLETTTKVGNGAFYGSQKLAQVQYSQVLETVGEYGFYDCSRISWHDLPQSLTYIQRYGFACNTSLTNLQIPDKVYQISNMAFAHCDNLHYVTFGENSTLPRISYEAFAYSGIVELRVPASVSTIAQGAFKGCNILHTVTFAANSQLTSVSAYMFEGGENILRIQFENGSALRSIQAHGFEGMKDLETVDFGDAKLENIDNYAFRYCESLETLELPDSLTSIGRYAFYGCQGLERLDIPAAVEHIGENAFYQATKLNVYFEAERLPANLVQNWDNSIQGYYVGVSQIKESGDWRYAVLGSGNISLVEYLGSAKTLDLNQVKLGGPIVSIGGYCFYGSSITSITLPSTLKEIHRYAFAQAPLTQIVLPDSLEFIGRYAFSASKLSQVTLGSGLEVMEQYAFANCENLKQITIPASLQTMGRYAFSKSGLEAVDFTEATLTTLPEGAFLGTKLKTVTLPASLALVDHSAFRDCLQLETVSFGSGQLQLMSNVFYNSGLKQVHIPDNVTYIGEYSFVGLKNLKEFTVSASHEKFTVIDGLLYSKDGKKLIAAPAGKTGALTLPESLEVLGFGAFENSGLTKISFHPKSNILTFGYRCFYNAALESIDIPATVVSFDYYAFAMCKNLKTVYFAADTQLKGIYEGAFYGCLKLENIVLPESIVEISDYAFYGCRSLRTIPVSENAKLLGIYDYAFAFSGIEEVQLSGELIDIGAYAFQGTGITSASIESDNAQQLVIGIGAFADCNQLTQITLPFVGASFEDEQINWFGYIFGAGSYTANDTYIPKSLETVYISEGIRRLYQNSFYDNNYQERNENVTVYLPESLREIDTFGPFFSSTMKFVLPSPISFFGDSGLETSVSLSALGECTIGTVRLAEGITEIKTSARLMYVEEIILPASLRVVGERAFSGCESMKSIAIPEGVEAIGARAFYFCRSLDRVKLPSTLRTIQTEAFSGCGIAVIDIPEGVTTIEREAFQHCNYTLKVTLPSTLQTVGENAFAFCTSLYEVVNNSTLQLRMGQDFTDLGCIGQYAKIIVNADGSKQSAQGEEFFILETPDQFRFTYYNGTYTMTHYMGTEKTVTLPVSVQGSSYEIKNLQGDIRRLIIPEGITRISDNAFEYMYDLESVSLPSTLKEIGTNAFSWCNSLEGIDLPYGLERIGQYAFTCCWSLESVELPDTVLWLGYGTFTQCTSLEQVKLSAGLDTLPQYFLSGTKVKEVQIPSGIRYLDYGAFGGCAELEELVIPEGVIHVGDFLLYENEKITSIHLPDSVEYVGDGLTKYSNIQEVTISDTNTRYKYQNDVLYTVDMSRMIFVSPSVTEIEIPATIQNIGYVLSDKQNLKKVTFAPDHPMTDLMGSAFAGCTNLEYVQLPEGLQSIGDNVFEGCEKLTSIDLPEGLQHLGGSAFAGWTGLTHMDLPANVIDYPGAMFEGCVNLESVTLPEGLTELGSKFFANCDKLRQVQLPSTLETVDYGCFQGCDSLESLQLPAGVQSIGSYAFAQCVNLKSIIIPDTVTELGSELFYNCSSLKNVTLPGTMTQLPEFLFYECASLETVDLPAGIRSIPRYAFYNCTNLTSLVIPEGVKYIEEGAFSNCNNLSSITLPSTLEGIAANSMYCQKLYEIINRSSLVLSFGSNDHGGIAWNALVIEDANGNRQYKEGETYSVHETADGFRYSIINGQYQLEGYVGTEKTITLPLTIAGNPYTINGFKGNMEHVIIPEGVKVIDFAAFCDCRSLKQITLPESLEVISNLAFAKCVNLTSVRIPANVREISSQAFGGCWALETIVLEGRPKKIAGAAFDGTAYSENPDHWEDGCLWLYDTYVLSIGPEVEEFTARGPISYDALSNAYRLHTLTVKQLDYGDLASASNLETLVLTESLDISLGDAFSRETKLTFKNVIIKKGVEIMDPHFFDYIEGVNIYVEAQELDVSWDKDYPGWNNNNRVYYGGEWITGEFVDEDGSLIGRDYFLTTSVIRQPYAPNKQDGDHIRVFAGWDLDGDGAADPVPATSQVSIRAKAIYKSHRPGKAQVTEPTCTENGLRVVHCLDCGQEIEYLVLRKLGHHSEKLLDTVAPKCSAEGYEVHKCADCGAQYHTNFTPRLEHIYGNWAVDEAATCTTNGKQHRSCSGCGHREDALLLATNHAYTVQVTRKPTCTEGGISTYTCADCGHVYEAALGTTAHRFEKKTANQSFLNHVEENDIEVVFGYEGGKSFYYACTDCGYFMNQQEQEMALSGSTSSVQSVGCQHTLGDWQQAQAPTCNGPGLAVQKCSKCGLVAHVKLIPSVGGEHSYVSTVTPPTCTDKGYTTHTCSNCADSYRDAYVNETGHSYSDVVTPPTASDKGFTTHTCDACGHSYIDSYTELVGPTQITSDVFVIAGDLLSKVSQNLGVREFLSKLADAVYTVTKDGGPVKEDAIVGTGMTVNLLKGEQVQHSATVVVTGDTNGDGKTTITDLLAVKAQLLGKSKLEGAAAYAADTSGDQKITVTDFIQMKAHILGKEAIKPQPIQAIQL